MNKIIKLLKDNGATNVKSETIFKKTYIFFSNDGIRYYADNIENKWVVQPVADKYFMKNIENVLNK